MSLFEKIPKLMKSIFYAVDFGDSKNPSFPNSHGKVWKLDDSLTQ